MQVPKNEHEKRDTLSEDVFYPDHPPRKESPTFVHTKKEGHKAKLPCCISGHTEGTEYHHVFVEWAFAEAIDWDTVKGVALGDIKELPVLDLHSDQPNGEMYSAEKSLIYTIIKLAEARGFNWVNFNPAKPEEFVDSMANMLVLHAKFHRLKNHGVHAMSAPEWMFQAWPRKKGFIFTPDEE